MLYYIYIQFILDVNKPGKRARRAFSLYERPIGSKKDLNVVLKNLPEQERPSTAKLSSVTVSKNSEIPKDAISTLIDTNRVITNELISMKNNLVAKCDQLRDVQQRLNREIMQNNQLVRTNMEQRNEIGILNEQLQTLRAQLFVNDLIQIDEGDNKIIWKYPSYKC